MMRKLSTSLKLMLLMLAFAVAVAASQFLFSRARIDLTEDNLYTLNDGTRKILATLKEPVKLRFTYSERAASGYPEVQAYAKQVEELLANFARASKGKITVERITPEPFSEAEDIAVQAGLRGAPTATGENLYFGLEATNSTTGRKVIPFFSTDREPQLEYDVISLVSRLAKPSKPKAAIYSTLPLPFGPGGPIAMVQGNSRPYAMYLQLREQFALTHIEPDFSDIPADTNLLLIVHPRPMSPAQVFAIDQFVMRGGRLMLFIDPMSEMALSMRSGGGMMPNMLTPPLASDLPQLLNAWGVKLAPGQVAADGKFPQQVSVQDGRPLYYLPWIGVQSSSFNKDSLSLQGLRQINVATSGILELSPRDGIATETLYTTSEVAGVFDATLFTDNPDPLMLIETFRPTGAKYTLAARLTGTFTSAFQQAPSADMPFLKKSAKPAAIVIVADTDMLTDALWVNIGGSNDSPTYQPIADNAGFVFNAADQLLGEEALMSLRSRRMAARPFTLVQEKQIEAERELRGQQASLMEELTTTQSRIAQMEGTGGTSEKFLSKAQKAEIEAFRKKVTDTRKSLRTIQGQLRRSVEALTTRITVLNVITIPLLLLMISLARAVLRDRRAKRAA
jgi:ABC-type uncharacterized transport system involved in gliding motility auxiliary subunit